MTRLDLSTILPAPLKLGDAAVVAFDVRPLFFLAYIDVAEEASDEIATTKGRYETALQRRRLIRQCVGLTADGAEVRLDDETLTTLPVAVGRALLPLLSSEEATGAPGSILTMMADGVMVPLLYKLGTPIATGGVVGEDGKEERAISEIEFHAPTFGAIEDVLAALTKFDQTAELIRKVGHPVDMVGMPSWVAERITISDGLTIMNTVLPRFLM